METSAAKHVSGGMKAGQDRQTGLSLVEILVAMFLFSIGALAVLTMTSGSFQANSYSEALDGATNLGRTKLDLLASLPFDDPWLEDVTADGAAGLGDNRPASSPPGDPLRADFTETSGRYKVFWNIARNTPVSGTKRIAVIVAWEGNTGAKQVVFQTVKAN